MPLEIVSKEILLCFKRILLIVIVCTHTAIGTYFVNLIVLRFQYGFWWLVFNRSAHFLYPSVSPFSFRFQYLLL